MKYDFLNDVYKDFFGVESPQTENKIFEVEDDNKDMADLFLEIDGLFIIDDSKDLLKKIIEYMRKYKEKIETNHIIFNISINSNDNVLISTIASLINKAAKMYDYISSSAKEISLYKITEQKDLSDNMILFKELKGIELEDLAFKNKFANELLNRLENSPITIIADNNDNLESFYLLDPKIKDYFMFNIEYQKPSVSDLYNEIIGKTNITEEEQISLLDYITDNYPKSDLKYSLYRDNLINYISFNKKIPEKETTKTLDEVFASLNELVGLKKVKQVLKDLVDLIELRKKDPNLKIGDVNLHMVFLGNPGTGKTTVARCVANILFDLGYIKQNKLLEVSAKDLVAEYVGQTAPKTNSVIEKAINGVLFIDEAYSLASNGQNSYNDEAIATLIQAMENHRNDLVVIFAGYTKEMQSFLDSNSGIVSRIGYTLEFDDYTEDELVEIFKGMVKKAGFLVEDNAILKLRELIKEYQDTPNFGNARFVRNIYEKSIIKHAANTKDKKQKKILKTITKEDINDENLIK